MATPKIGGYRDLVEIGRGGFGVVYRAFETAFERHVAIKVIENARPDEATLARFERECRATGVLSGHPNIVAAHAAGRTEEGLPYLVMDYLGGGSVAEQIRRDGPASPQVVTDLGITMAGALETAHRAGIVHRDIKPENILYSSFGTPKLVDFGIARMRSAYETRTGSISATLMHAAPEIVAGGKATASSDIYSLASVLYFMLAGHAPHWRPDEESLAPLLARIATSKAPSLVEFGASEALAAVIGQALSTQPADRPASAEAFGRQLRDTTRPAGAVLPTTVVTLTILDLVPPGGAQLTEAADPAEPAAATGEVVRDRLEPTPEPVASPARRGRRKAVAALAGVGIAAAAVGIAFAATHDDGNHDGNNLAQAGRTQHHTSTGSPSAADSSSSSSSPSMPSSSASQKIPKPTPTKSASSTPNIVPNGGGVSSSASASHSTASHSHPPTISVSSLTSSEMQNADVAIRTSDPDGDAVTVTALSALPDGTRLSGHSIIGQITDNAVDLTRDYHDPRTKSFTITLRASDGHGHTATATFTWTIRDTYTPMFEYVGTCACSAGGYVDAQKQLSPKTATRGVCTSASVAAAGNVVSQSVAKGTPFAWGTGSLILDFGTTDSPPC